MYLPACWVCRVFVGAHKGQKAALCALKLKFQMVMSYYMGAGIQTWVLYKSNKYS